MEQSIEIVLEKLLHVTKDDVAKVYVLSHEKFSPFLLANIFLMLRQVSNEAHQCLYVVLAKYDPFRCLSVCPEYLLITKISSYITTCCNQQLTFSWISLLVCRLLCLCWVVMMKRHLSCVSTVWQRYLTFCTVVINHKNLNLYCVIAIFLWAAR